MIGTFGMFGFSWTKHRLIAPSVSEPTTSSRCLRRNVAGAATSESITPRIVRRSPQTIVASPSGDTYSLEGSGFLLSQP